MNKFSDSSGKNSMIRVLSFMIVLTALAWGTGEIIYSMFKPEFVIHTAFITSVLGIGIAGKVGQKIIKK